MRTLSIILCLALMLPLACLALAPDSSFSLSSASEWSQEIKRLRESEEFKKRAHAFTHAWNHLKPGQDLLHAFKAADKEVLEELGVETPSLNIHNQIYPLMPGCVYMRGKIQTGPFKGKDCFLLLPKKGSPVLKDAEGMMAHVAMFGHYGSSFDGDVRSMDGIMDDTVRRYEEEEKRLPPYDSTYASNMARVRLANRIFREERQSIPKEAWLLFMNKTALKGQPMLVRTTAAIMQGLFQSKDIKAYVEAVFPGDVFRDDAFAVALHAIAADLAGKSYEDLNGSQRKLIAHRMFYALSLKRPKNEWQQHAKELLHYLALGSPWGDWAYFLPPDWAEASGPMMEFFSVEIPQEPFDWDCATALSEPGYLDRYRKDFEEAIPADWQDALFRHDLAKTVMNDAHWWSGMQKELAASIRLRLKSARFVTEVRTQSDLDSLIRRAREAEREMLMLEHDIKHDLKPLETALKFIEFALDKPILNGFQALHHVRKVLNKVEGGGIHSAKTEREARQVLEKLKHYKQLLRKTLLEAQQELLKIIAMVKTWDDQGMIGASDKEWVEKLEHDYRNTFERAMALLEHEKSADVRLQDLITEQAVKLFFPGKGFTVHVEMDAACPPLHLPPRQFVNRVLSQFFINARDVMGNAGSSTVRVLPYRGWVRIEIEDTGPGVPKEIRSHIFDHKFTHGKEGGTGLGLDIAKEFIQSYGGSVWEEGEEGKGAKFVMVLPAAGDGLRQAQQRFGQSALASMHQAVLLPETARVSRPDICTVYPHSGTYVMAWQRSGFSDSPRLPDKDWAEYVSVGRDAVGMHLDIRHPMEQDLEDLAARLTANGPEPVAAENLKIAVPFQERNKPVVWNLIRAGLRVQDGSGRLISTERQFEEFWAWLRNNYLPAKPEYGKLVLLPDDMDFPLGLFTGAYHYCAGYLDLSVFPPAVRDGELIASLTEILGGQMSSRAVNRENGRPAEQVLSAGDWSRSPEKAVVFTAIKDHPVLKDLKGIRVDSQTGDKTVCSLIAAWGQPVRIIEVVYEGGYRRLREAIARENDAQQKCILVTALAQAMMRDAKSFDPTLSAAAVELYQEAAELLRGHAVPAPAVPAVQVLESAL